MVDYVLGTALGLVLNKKYTFKIKDKINLKTARKAIIANIFIFVLNLSILFLLINILKYNEYLSQLFALIVISISSFLFYQFYIFQGIKYDQ